MTGCIRAVARACKRWAFARLLASSLVISLASGVNAWGETPAASADALSLSAAQRAWLKAHPDIVLGSSDQLPPGLMRDGQGRLIGLLADVLELLNQRLGTEIRLHALPDWSAVSEQALAGDIDGLFAVARLPVWQEHFLLTEVYLTPQVYVYSRAGETQGSGDIRTLFGQRVGMLRGFKHIEQLLGAYSDEIEVVPYDSTQALASALLAGDVDQVVAEGTFDWWRRENLLVGFGISGILEQGSYEVSSAIRQDWPELVEMLNLALASITDAEWSTLRRRWLSSLDRLPETETETLALTAAEQAWLDAHPEIVLGISDQFQPDIIIGPDGSQSGQVVDLMVRLNDLLGGRLKLHVEHDWNAVTDKAIAREIDGLAASSPNAVWDQHFFYTDPLYRGIFYLYRRVDDTPFRGRAQLAGQRVGYLEGMRKAEQLLAESPDLTLAPLPDYASMAEALSNGEVDVLLGQLSMEWWRRQHANLAIRPTGILEGSEHLAVMSIRDDWPELVSILNKALRAIPAAERARINARWFGEAEDLSTPARPTLTLSSEARAWLDAHQPIRFAVSRDWAPVDFYNSDDQPAGIAPDYLERIGEMLDVRFEPVPIEDWPQAMAGLQQGQIDLLPAATPTPERERNFLFTDPYLEFPIAIFAPVQTPLINQLSTLHGQRVIVIEGHAIQRWLHADHPDIQLVPVSDARTAVRALAQGQGEALIGNLFAISQAIAHEQLFQLRVAGQTPYRYRLAMAVRPDWQPLLAILEQALAAIPPAEREVIQSRWLRASPPARIDTQLLWQIALGTALVLTVLLIWTLSLKREIAQRRRAERSLAASEQRYRGMVESASSVLQFYAFDAQGVLLDVSAGSRKLFGIDDRDMVGKHWHEIAAWSPDTRERIQQALATCWLDRVPVQATLHYELEGEPRSLISFARPVMDESNRVLRIEGLSVNLTERLRLQEAVRELESDLHALIEHSPIPLLISTGKSAQILLVNQRFLDLIGYTPEEIGDIDHWFELAYPDPEYRHQVSAEWQQRVERALATNGALEPMEARLFWIFCDKNSHQKQLVERSAVM